VTTELKEGDEEERRDIKMKMKFHMEEAKSTGRSSG